jgi:hypothetical protein
VQIVEYLRAFLMARLALSRMQVLTVISGAFGLFKRQLALEVGGYSHGTVGEDMELVVKLHRHMRDQKKPYRIEFIPEPVCWTEAPDDLTILGRQRRAGSGARWRPSSSTRTCCSTRATDGSASWASGRYWWSTSWGRSWRVLGSSWSPPLLCSWRLLAVDYIPAGGPAINLHDRECCRQVAQT